MTEFFPYENLTWPEVAALPRDIPLVLPLGNGYPMDALAQALSNPSRAGLLPPIPFGWRESGLAVPEPVLAAYAGNLLRSIRDDGFTRVYGLLPKGLELDLGLACIHLPASQRLRSIPALPTDGEKNKVILMPIGHTEQHGFHLPLNVDTLIIEAIANGAAAGVPELAFSMPVMPYGVSTHRAAFAGTLNAGGRAFEDFWLAVVETLINRGFSRFYLMSGHGGNCSFLVNAVKYAGERHPEAFIATAWLYLSGPKGAAALEAHRQSGIGGMGHACELETSFILHLRPELVDMNKAVDETDFITTKAYYMDWLEGGALVANPPWEDDTRTGAYGAGSLATAEKGRIWLEAAIEEKIDHIHEIHQQYRRRNQRRESGWALHGKITQS